jgi:hypothetical protein
MHISSPLKQAKKRTLILFVPPYTLHSFIIGVPISVEVAADCGV